MVVLKQCIRRPSNGWKHLVSKRNIKNQLKKSKELKNVDNKNRLTINKPDLISIEHHFV